MAVVWSYENAAHLLRRVGFGGTPKNIQKFLDSNSSVDSAVDELLSFKPSKRKPPSSNKEPDEDRLRKMQEWWIRQMVKTRKPEKACHEKIVLFLHDHLASGLSKQPSTRNMAFQQRLFRFNARGNFKDLIREFNRDPANLYYLDGILNVASNDGVHVNANENWGRELVELFTLGVLQLSDDGTPDPAKPNYTEDDVHGLARASTGWTSIHAKIGEWNIEDWDGGQYDDDGDDLPDPMTIFGQTSNNFRIDEGVSGTSDDILELIFSRQDDDGNNQVGIFLAWKLWSHRLLRWLVVPMLLFALGTNLLLLDRFPYGALLASQLVLYATAIMGLIPALRRIKIFWIPLYFCVVNLAAIIGVWLALGRRVSGTWEPVERV